MPGVQREVEARDSIEGYASAGQLLRMLPVSDIVTIEGWQLENGSRRNPI
jgi:hypothetical protein